MNQKNTLSHSAAETYGALLPPMVNATLNLPMVLQAPVTQASLAVALYLAGWGIHEGKTFVKEQGEPWASRNPHVVAYLHEMSDDTPIEDILEFARSKLSAMNL